MRLNFDMHQLNHSPKAQAIAFESFTLTLMTGARAFERSRSSRAQCRHVLQEQAYAQDLANRPLHS